MITIKTRTNKKLNTEVDRANQKNNKQSLEWTKQCIRK